MNPYKKKPSTCAGRSTVLTAPSRKYPIALLLLLALCAASCKSQKTTLKQTTQTQNNEQTQSRTETNNTDSRTIDFTQADHTTHDETTTQETCVTDWSAPDPLGRQYPVRTTKSSTTTRRGQHNDIQTTVTDNHTATTHTVSREQTDTQQQEQTKTDSTQRTETKTPAWLIWLILGIIAALTIIVLIALKHYHII